MTLLGRSTERSEIADIQRSEAGSESSVGREPGHMAGDTGSVDLCHSVAVGWLPDMLPAEHSTVGHLKCQ